MNIDELENFLLSFQPIYESNDVEETLSDITITTRVVDLGYTELVELLRSVYEYPELVSDCSIDVVGDSGSLHLIRLTGSGFSLNQDTIRELPGLFGVDGPEYESRISSHIEHDRDDELLESISDLLIDIQNQSGVTVDFPLILDKSQINNVILDNNSIGIVDSSSLNPQFWYNIELFEEWLLNHSFSDYASRIFEIDSMPVIFYFMDGVLDIDGTRTLPVHRFTEDFEINQGDVDKHKAQVELVNENSTFQSGAPIIPPSSIANSDDLRHLLRSSFLYALYSVFSDRIILRGPEIEFQINRGPNSISTRLDIDVESNNLDSELFEGLADLYSDYSQREDREIFVGFWRRSIAQHCDEITDIPYNIQSIKEHYQFIEAETVEGQFDELSDAIRDTHAFMTDITSQVAETTRGLSNEIQRMVFTLLGAILANLFLVLRWGNIDMVIPFSLFVISAMLVFYFPLVDRRIDELDEMKSKSEMDYDTYDELITGFSGEAFDFDELEDRKDDYMDYANQRIEWAQTNLRRIHTSLLVIGLAFVVLATSLYPRVSSQLVLSLTFLISIGYLSIRVYSNLDDHTYYRIGLPWTSKQYRNHLPAIIAAMTGILIMLNAFSGCLPLASF